MNKAKGFSIRKISALKQIRKFCLECHGGYRPSRIFCCDTKCPLWNLRLGMSPKRVINERGKNYRELFIPDNFKRGGLFSPDKQPDAYPTWRAFLRDKSREDQDEK